MAEDSINNGKLNIRIKKSVLLEAIQKTLGIVEKKSSLPILNHALLKAGNGKLAVVASDLAISLISEYEAEIISGGEVSVAARKLYEVAKELEGEDIQLMDTGDKFVKIKAGKSVHKIFGLPAEDYPSVIDDTEDVAYCQISGMVLSNLIAGTMYAASDDSHRSAAMTGVFLETAPNGHGKVWSMVGTDGWRLSLVREEAEQGVPGMDKGVIIPRKGLMEIKKLVNGQESVDVGLRKNMLVVKVGETILKATLMDAEYPQYGRIVANTYENKMKLDKESFLQVLKRMRVCASKEHASLTLHFSEGNLKLVLENLDVGTASEDLDTEYNGDEGQISVNVEFMLEGVSAVPSKEILLEANFDALKPLMIRAADGKDFIGVIMPLKN